MKRAIKILTLILIVVFVFSVFASCDLLIGKDVAKYRKQVAMKVGNEEITVGKLLDTFNTYYNNYYYYVSAGYFTIDYLLEMVVSSLTQQYMQIDDYVTSHDAVTLELKGVAHNAEYLTSEEFEYCIKYVLHVTFTTFDTGVEEQLAAKHDLKAAETEDTSRDFTEYDDLKGAKNYAEYYFKNQNFNSEEADEYFEKYYAEVLSFVTVNDIVKFVYDSNDNGVADERLQELNDRLEDDSDEITFEELTEIQQKVLTQYRDTVKSSYGITLENFLANQVDDMVSSCILAKWNYEAYEGLDQDEDFTAMLTERFELEKNKQIADFNENDDAFDSFITSLSSSSYIYNVPEANRGQYVFVKNILVPFTNAQKNALNALANKLGGSDNDKYIEARNLIAAGILADYFDNDKYDEDIENTYFSNENWFVPNTDEDADRKYERIGDLFTVEDGNLAINSDGVLGQFFKANGVVDAMGGKTGSETIIELMKRFNTDTAQHTSQYDYVVYVGEDWEDYSHSWVKEFYTAVNEMGGREENSEFSSDNVGKYTMCVSTYGVHIIYVEGFVEDSEQVFSELDFAQSTVSTSTFYRWFVSTFTSELQKRTQDKFDEMEERYLKDNKISITKEFSKFLKENSFTFDLDAYLEEKMSEYAD